MMELRSLPIALVVIGLVAGTGIAADATPEAEAAPEEAPAHKSPEGHAGGGAKEHEPNPIEHVLDKEFIEIFESLGVKIPLPRISLPLLQVGGFQVTRYMV